MTIITKGRLLTNDWEDGDMEPIGEYWTCMTIDEHCTVCVRYMGQLLNMDTSKFPDWLLAHELYIEDGVSQVYPFDFRLDCE